MPRKDGKPRGLPAPLGLDPLPWDANTARPEHPDDNRYSYDLGADLEYNGMAVEFDPRPGYSQNPEDYA